MLKDNSFKRNKITEQSIVKINITQIINKNSSVEQVREYIKDKLLNAKKQDLEELLLISGEIHKELNMHNAMPTVCSAMRTLGNEYNYIEIEAPPKGNGSRLKFKYILNK